MRIIITGSDGYVGWYLSEHLCGPTRNEHLIRIDSRNGTPYQSTPPSFIDAVSHVIHLAAHSSVGACTADPVGAIQNNLTDLIDFARKLRGRTLIFASTGSVYSRTGATSVYDLTKALAEKALTDICATQGVPLHVLRFGTVAGVSPVMREDLILNGMTRDAVRTGVVTVRNPSVWRPVLFLPDLAWFIDRILAGEVEPGIHDLASFQARVGGWADIVAKATGARIETAEPAPTYDFRMPTLDGAPGRLDSVVAGLVEHWTAKVG